MYSTECPKKFVPFFIFFPRYPVCGEWCKFQWLLLGTPSFDLNNRRSRGHKIFKMAPTKQQKFLKKLKSFSAFFKNFCCLVGAIFKRLCPRERRVFQSKLGVSSSNQCNLHHSPHTGHLGKKKWKRVQSFSDNLYIEADRGGNNSGVRRWSVGRVSLFGMQRHLGCDLVAGHITTSLTAVRCHGQYTLSHDVNRTPWLCTEVHKTHAEVPKTRSQFVYSEIYFNL
jgi:hypothetical protein